MYGERGTIGSLPRTYGGRLDLDNTFFCKACGGVTIRIDDMAVSMPRETADVMFNLKGVVLTATEWGCDRCVNHWSTDMCICGSGKPPDKCCKKGPYYDIDTIIEMLESGADAGSNYLKAEEVLEAIGMLVNNFRR